jgi:hypothetical protein
MSDNDLMTDSPELRELRDALSGVVVPERPGLEAIAARGRARRRRRRSGAARLSVVGAVAATAISVTPIGVHGRATTLVTIRTAAYTLSHHHNGTDTLTLNPGELFDPAQLQSDRPLRHAVRHRVERRQLPVHHGRVCRRAAGRHEPHRHQLLHLHQHPAHPRT